MLRWCVIWGLMCTMPCAFYASAYFGLPLIAKSQQSYVFMGLALVSICVQLELAVLPLARSISRTASSLPALTKAAFAAERAAVGKKVAVLAKQLAGNGSTPADSLLGGMSKVLISALDPALKRAEELLDVADFIPSKLQDSQKLARVIGFSFMLLYVLFICPWLINFMSLGPEALSNVVLVVLVVLLAAACSAGLVALSLVLLAQRLLNYALHGLLVKLIRTDEIPMALRGPVGKALFKARDCNATTAQFLTAQFSAALESPPPMPAQRSGCSSGQKDTAVTPIPRQDVEASLPMRNVADVAKALAGLVKLDLRAQSADMHTLD